MYGKRIEMKYMQFLIILQFLIKSPQLPLTMVEKI